MGRWVKRLAALSLVAGTWLPDIAKNAAYNVMSNVPMNMSVERLIEYPQIAFQEGTYRGTSKSEDCDLSDVDLPGFYTGLKQNTFQISEHQPTSLTGSEEMTFYDPGCAVRADDPRRFLIGLRAEDAQRIANLEIGEAHSLRFLPPGFDRTDGYGVTVNLDLGTYTVSVGRDEQGKYLSIYDSWDFVQGKGGFYGGQGVKFDLVADLAVNTLGKPIHFYKRFYFDELGIEDAHLVAVANYDWNALDVIDKAVDE